MYNIELSKTVGQRINEQLAIQEKKQKDLAQYLGVRDNIISYFCSGTRIPNTEQIKKIAEFLNVSADYLLGLLKTSSTDKDIKGINKYMGLDYEVIDNISHNPEVIKILNYLFSDKKMFDFLLPCINLEAYKRKTAEYNDYLASILSAENPENLNPVELFEKRQDYIDSIDLKEFQTDKSLKTIRNSLFDFYNATSNDAIKEFEELLQNLWEKDNGNNTQEE